MTLIGWIQILLFCAIVVALVKPLGGYMTRVFNGERTFLSPALRPVEGVLYRLGGVDEKREQHWLTYTVAMLLFHRRRLPAALRADAPAGGAAAQSGRPVGGARRSRLQHRRQLRHQHQLAELRRRKHDVLPRADARPDGAELRVGRHRHRAGGRAHSRLCARLRQHHRQFLGRCHALHALRPAADLRRSSACSWSGRACRRRWAAMSTRPRWRAPSRPSRSARSPRRSPSRCSAPTAAASSTPTPRIPSRTPPRCRTSCR